MKRNFLIFILFNSCMILYSQSSKKVEYGVLFNIEEIKDERMKNSFFIKTINEYKENIIFDLIFNDSISNFKTKEQLNIENKGKINYASYMVIDGEYYFNSKSSILIKKLDDLNCLITNKLIWTLRTEEKFIDGMKCYKATSEKTVINSKGKFVFPITAWYAPDLPYSFGPGMFVGLPGLILEVRDRNFVIFAKKLI